MNKTWFFFFKWKTNYDTIVNIKMTNFRVYTSFFSFYNSFYILNYFGFAYEQFIDFKKISDIFQLNYFINTWIDGKEK